MVDTSMFSEVGGGIVETIFSSILWIGLAIIVMGVIAIFGWWFGIYRKKFDIKAKIIFERAGEKNWVRFDKAAILVDRKTRTKYFRIWGLKIDLPVPKNSVLQSTNEGDYIEIYSPGEDEFYFLTPARINKTQVIRSDGKLYATGEYDQNRIDSDVARWNIIRKNRNKGIFDMESMLMKLLPYIPFIMGGAFMVFMLYILMDHLPGILAQLKELTTELNRRQTAEVISGLCLFWRFRK